MTANNHHSNFSSKPKLIKFYRLDEFPEAIFLVEAESVDRSVDKTKKTEASLRRIIFPLGMIAISIVLSVFQLYRALEVTPSAQTSLNSEIQQP